MRYNRRKDRIFFLERFIGRVDFVWRDILLNHRFKVIKQFLCTERKRTVLPNLHLVLTRNHPTPFFGKYSVGRLFAAIKKAVPY